MQKEYLFYDQTSLEYPLDESIEVVNSFDNVTNRYIVSNVKTESSCIYAPEINFYIKNSQDDLSAKITNVKKLYDIRAESFDVGNDEEFTQKVENRVVILSQSQQESLVSFLENSGFVSITIEPSNFLALKGHIGDLHVSFKQDEEELEIMADQLIYFEQIKGLEKKAGVYEAKDLTSEKIVKLLKENSGEYRYKNFFTYNSEICQYHHRRGEICTDCVQVCPTGAITKLDSKKELVFSHIYCVACGMCIGVCPTGALDLVGMSLDAFSAMSNYFKECIVLLVPKKVDLESLHVKLPKGVLPFVIESKDAFNEAQFMTLLQTSGNPVLFFTKSLKGAALEVVELINEIFQRKYNKQAIFTCKDETEILNACEVLTSLTECKYGISQEGMAKREIFSARLAHLVGEDNLGVVQTQGDIHYGNLKIDEEKCTLCFSCIGACNVKALTAHPEDNSLRFNPSLCTSCGYCEASCAEKGCITIIENELSLEPNYFVKNIMAKDELFKCTECGVEFATVKSVQKIASIMAPHFANDALKMKTLYCCAACKPKVMLQDGLEKGFLKQ